MAKTYLQLNLRLSQDLKESLDLLAAKFGVEDTYGAYPRIVRMAVRSLRFRLESLDHEFGRDFKKVCNLTIEEDGD